MAGRIIVTHFNPDLDAITSVWLIVRWLPGWADAELKIVPAGATYQGQPPDANPSILHVDTGLGMLDHHQTKDYTCAAKKTFEYIKNNNHLLKAALRTAQDKQAGEKRKATLNWSETALSRMVEIVNQIDHFQEVYFPQPEADYWEFMTEAIFDGMKLLYKEEDVFVIEQGLKIMDAVYVALQSKVEGERILLKKGFTFQTAWGEGFAVETKNSEVVSLAQKKGYIITVRKHPVQGHVKIKTLPPDFLHGKEAPVDLTPAYHALKRADPAASWFLHASKTMLLNGSAKNPRMRPTKLTLKEVVAIISRIKQ